MFNFFKAAQEHLGAITVNNRIYISGGKLKQGVTDVNDGLKKNIHISQLIDSYNLEYAIMTRGKTPQLANIDLDAYKANPRKYELRICSDSVQAAGAIIEILSRKYVDCIENPQPDAIDDSDASTDSEEDEYEEKAPASSRSIEDEDEEKAPAPLPQQTNILYRGNDPCPIIELEDHEKFVDGDRIFEIEIRGERSPEKILFKVEDIARLFGMSNLAKDMLNKDIYQEEIHYVILSLDPNYPHTGYGRNRRAFLTTDGMLRVCTSSRSQAYRMMPWVIQTLIPLSNSRQGGVRNILIDHQSKSDPFAGIYLIRIGNVKDLRLSMKISQATYPSDFDNAFLYKYGRSRNLFNRIEQHRSSLYYGKYSDSIDFELMFFIEQSITIEAEAALSGYFTESNLKFDFTDDSGKEHTELVIIKHDELQGVREEYIKMINKYPNAENAISLFIDNLKSQYQSQIADLKHENEILKLTHAAELKEKDMLIKDEKHQNEIIKLKLEFAEFRLESKQR